MATFKNSEELESECPEGVNLQESLDQFEQYYVHQWLPLTEWLSVYKCETRTNNNAEAFNSILTSRLQSHRPGMYKMLEYLIQVEGETRSRLRQMTRGSARQIRKTKYTILDAKIESLWVQLDEGEIDCFDFVDIARDLMSTFRYGG